jgi:hypothetical protein
MAEKVLAPSQGAAGDFPHEFPPVNAVTICVGTFFIG